MTYISKILFIGFLSFLYCKDIYCNEPCLYSDVIKDYETNNFEKEGYPVINYVIDDPTITENLIHKLKAANFKSFNINDIDTLQLQIENFNTNDLKCIKSKKIVPESQIQDFYRHGYDGFWLKFENVFGKSGYYKISAPVYTKNRKRFIILLETTYYKLNSVGHIFIYSNENNIWKLERSVLAYY